MEILTSSEETEYQKAYRLGCYWKHLGNLASERGEQELAERHYQRGQKWLDKVNEMDGLGEEKTPIIYALRLRVLQYLGNATGSKHVDEISKSVQADEQILLVLADLIGNGLVKPLIGKGFKITRKGVVALKKIKA